MKEIVTYDEYRDAFKQERSVILFGKEDCIHCSIVKNCIKSIEKNYPLVNFYYTIDFDFANARSINHYPELVFYNNGSECGRLAGSEHVNKLKELINIWILKL